MHLELMTKYKTGNALIAPHFESLKSEPLSIETLERIKSNLPRLATMIGVQAVGQNTYRVFYFHKRQNFSTVIWDNVRSKDRVKLAQVELENIASIYKRA